MSRLAASPAATERAGEEFATLLRPGDVVLLSGPLGAGKTTFVRGLARGLGVRERATSPTFTMVRQHQCHNDLGIVTLHHADVYRIQSLDEVVDLALGELVEEDAVAVVEWGELAAPVFGSDVVTISIALVSDEARTIDVVGATAPDRAEAFSRWAS